MEFAQPSLIPLESLSVFVTKRSSPTSCTFVPSSAVSFFHPSQSSSSRASSMEMIGYFSTSFFQCSMSCSEAVSYTHLFLCLRIVQRYNGSHKGTCSGASMDGSSEDALRRRRRSTSSAQPYDKSRSRGRPLQVPSSSGNRIQRS